MFSKTAFQLGLFFQGLLPLILIILEKKAFHFLALLGTIKGVSAAFYWANLNLLTYDFTKDSNRGYFSGLSSTLASAIGIVASPLAGFVIGVIGQEWLKLNITNAYYLSFGTAIFIFVVTAIVAGEISPKKDKPTFSLKKVFSQKSKNWIKVRSLNFVTGLRDSVIPFLPALLALKFFGKEAIIGRFNGLMAMLSVLIGYLAGRFAIPKRRISLAGVGVAAFLIGAMFFGSIFTVFGFWLFSVLNRVGSKFFGVVHGPVQMREMDRGYLSEELRYNYWIDRDFFS